MTNYTLPQISGQLEYLENNLRILKQAFSDLVRKEKPLKKTLFGSLSKTNLTLSDFKKIRQKLSSSWKTRWSTS